MTATDTNTGHRYPILKHLPIPKARERATKGTKYDWDRLEVGDCIICPPGEEGVMRSAASTYSRKGRRKLISRTFSNGEVAIWRIS